MSALTSLLVRDDAVSVRQIEEAVSRQVVDGGELDTALLELGALPENQLAAYRAASERAQPATREEVMSASAATQALLPAELAIEFEVTPISHDAHTLTVAGYRSLSSDERSELAGRTGMRIEVRITTELRVHAALESFYGKALTARMAVLLRRVDAHAPGQLLSVAPLSGRHSRLRADKTLQLPAFEESDDFQEVLAAAFDRASLSSDGILRLPDPDETRPLSAKRAFEAQRKRGRAPETAKLGSPASVPLASSPQSSMRPGLAAKRVAVSLPQGPLTAAAAQDALSGADERDAVLEIYFRFARQFFDATLLFAVKEGNLLGLQSYNTPALLDVTAISLPISRGGTLDELSRTPLPRVVDLRRKEEDRALLSAIKRSDAQPSMLIPIGIKRRVVAALYGDRDGAPIAVSSSELAELIELVPHVTGAFERIIRTRKALGLGAANSSGLGDLSHAPTQRSIRVPPRDAASFGSEAQTADMDDSARHVLDSLKADRAAPVQQRTEDDGDIYATARIPIQPLALDQFESPPRYFAKPPPGTGRYQSHGPKHEGAQEILRRSEASKRHKAQANQRPAGPGSRNASAAARGGKSKRGTTGAESKSGATVKAGPGSGAYRSQIGTTELISVPGALRDPDSAAQAQVDASASFFLRSEPGRGAANQNDSDPVLSVEGPVMSMPPSSLSSAPPAPPSNSPAARMSSRPAPARSSRPAPSPSARPVGMLQQSRRASQLIDELCGTESGEDSPAVKALVALGEPALTLLLERFPGPLWFDRRKPHARAPLGRDISPVSRALDAFGEPAIAGVIPMLGSADTELRYYATLFACDRVDERLMEPLLERLFDDDPQIRLLVRDALPHYRRFAGFERVTEYLCEQARSAAAPLFKRLAAIDAISVLRDVVSVPTLIELIGDTDRQISVPSHRALSLITCQDFGKTLRKWRSWHAANAGRHRVEWLIEGLMHPDESLRAMAGLELQKLTQVYYGYVAAASKREREAAQKRYAEWWRTEGRARLQQSPAL